MGTQNVPRCGHSCRAAYGGIRVSLEFKPTDQASRWVHQTSISYMPVFPKFESFTGSKSINATALEEAWMHFGDAGSNSADRKGTDEGDESGAPGACARETSILM